MGRGGDDEDEDNTVDLPYDTEFIPYTKEEEAYSDETVFQDRVKDLEARAGRGELQLPPIIEANELEIEEMGGEDDVEYEEVEVKGLFFSMCTTLM